MIFSNRGNRIKSAWVGYIKSVLDPIVKIVLRAKEKHERDKERYLGVKDSGIGYYFI